MGIVHSGERGNRGTPVTDKKYTGLIGCKVSFDADSVCIGKSLVMWLEPHAHKLYDYWILSEIQRVDHDDEDGILIIETANSIYYLDEEVEQ